MNKKHESTAKAELKPTLWRTARALANADRLELLRLVYEAKSKQNVTDLAKRVNLAIPTTSTYLRALNARGLISVVRSGSFVFYGTSSDRSLPVAAAIQSAFFHFFRTTKLSRGWSQKYVSLFKGYAHPRRENIIRCLKGKSLLTFGEIHQKSGIHPIALLRHLAFLLKAGIITRDEEHHYTLVQPSDIIASTILKSLQ